MSSSGKSVPTKRERASTYLRKETYLKVEAAAQEQSITVSKWIENTILAALDEDSINIKLDPELLKLLRQLSKENFCNLDSQIRTMLVDYMRKEGVID